MLVFENAQLNGTILKKFSSESISPCNSKHKLEKLLGFVEKFVDQRGLVVAPPPLSSKSSPKTCESTTNESQWTGFPWVGQYLELLERSMLHTTML